MAYKCGLVTDFLFDVYLVVTFDIVEYGKVLLVGHR